MNTRHRPTTTGTFAAGAVSAAAVVATIAMAPCAAATQPTDERPCFIVQPRWNSADGGPQPTCSTPTWAIDEETNARSTARTDVSTDTTAAPAARVVDFMP